MTSTVWSPVKLHPVLTFLKNTITGSVRVPTEQGHIRILHLEVTRLHCGKADMKPVCVCQRPPCSALHINNGICVTVTTSHYTGFSFMWKWNPGLISGWSTGSVKGIGKSHVDFSGAEEFMCFFKSSPRACCSLSQTSSCVFAAWIPHLFLSLMLFPEPILTLLLYCLTPVGHGVCGKEAVY